MRWSGEGRRREGKTEGGVEGGRLIDERPPRDRCMALEVELLHSLGFLNSGGANAAVVVATRGAGAETSDLRAWR